MDAAHREGERVWDVVLTPHRLTLHLRDGRSVGAPLSWFPRLEGGDDVQRRNWRTVRDGCGVTWPDLGEEVDVWELLSGHRGSGLHGPDG